MKKTIVLWLFLSLWGVPFVAAQTVQVSQATVVRLDKRRCAVTLELAVAGLGSNQMARVVPVLESKGDSLVLCPVVVMGHDRRSTEVRTYRSHRRPKTKQGQMDHYADVWFRVAKTPNYKLTIPYWPGRRDLKSGRLTLTCRAKTYPERRNLLKVSYRFIVPYQKWLAGGQLTATTTISSCAASKKLSRQVLATNCLPTLLPHYDSTQSTAARDSSRMPYFRTAFLHPMDDYQYVMGDVGNLSAEEALMVHFAQGQQVLDSGYAQNARALARIDTVLEQIKADTNALLERIVLVGKASPEGIITHNQGLSQQRAETLRAYFAERSGSALIESIGGGEDWLGLEHMIESSELPEKEQLLELIQTEPNPSKRKQALQAHNQGESYRYLAERFFPFLRNAGQVLLFYSRREPIFVQYTPQDASRIRQEWAVELMNQGNYRGALRLLRQATSNVEADNLKGVCCMMLFDFRQAEYYFNRAIKQGSLLAAENLPQIYANGWPEPVQALPLNDTWYEE